MNELESLLVGESFAGAEMLMICISCLLVILGCGFCARILFFKWCKQFDAPPVEDTFEELSARLENERRLFLAESRFRMKESMDAINNRHRR